MSGGSRNRKVILALAIGSGYVREVKVGILAKETDIIEWRKAILLSRAQVVT